jgi:type VI secretion system protein ImpM
MPEFMSGAPAGSSLRDGIVGFYGKIPSRGDFVRSGLPHGFIEPWDRWMQKGIAASHDMLGDRWIAAWLQSAIWSFFLAPGVCGPNAVLGLWMPSVDRVGRHFPLTLAAVVPGPAGPDLVRGSGGFLAALEQAGLAALESDISPDELAARSVAATAAGPADPGIDPLQYPAAQTLWWTMGGRRVPDPGQAFAAAGLPEADTFVHMVVACEGEDPR